MARPRKSSELALWMNGQHVGRWAVGSRGEHQLHYDAAWVSSDTGRPVSLSMPLRPPGSPYTGAVVEHFFDNLLPENKTIRTRLAQRFRAPSTNAFDLLQALGRDCAGALQVLPVGQPPGDIHRVDAQALDEHGVAQLLARVTNGPAALAETEGDDAFRMSLAGAQEKTALLWQGGQWWLPQGATPSTHILKLPLGVFADGIDMSTSVDNELVCMRLLEAFDVPVARVAALRFEDRRVLAVERFDRRPSGKGGWLRLPQEDFAQVFGVSPAVKYEDHGGPGIERIAQQLLGSVAPERDRRDFLRTQVLYWMLAAIDGHAKNFAVFIGPRGAFELTPRYDVLSAYPVIGNKAGMLAPQKLRMAMAVRGENRHYRWSEFRRAHFVKTARDCGMREFDPVIDELVARTPAAIENVSAQLRDHVDARVADSIYEGLAGAARALARGGAAASTLS